MRTGKWVKKSFHRFGTICFQVILIFSFAQLLLKRVWMCLIVIRLLLKMQTEWASQLHQIRGRVGRSSRRAYAYFTFTRGKELTDIATRRLEAIREYTEFGSGFKIAMRDLEIRGAGSLLGNRQHGHMEAVGYDMYLKLLEEAVAMEKGEISEDEPEERECLIDVQIDAHLPEEYIISTSQRLSMYKRIAGIKMKQTRRMFMMN